MAKTTDSAAVKAFIDSIEDPARQADCRALLALAKRAVRGETPRLWPGGMVGVGDFHYRYASGREGDTFLVGFSPRKAALTIYLGCDLARYEPLLAKLGKFKHGKGCLYLRSLADVDERVLLQLMTEAAAEQRASRPS